MGLRTLKLFLRHLTVLPEIDVVSRFGLTQVCRDLRGLPEPHPRTYGMEPTIGIEPMNLFLTKEALYRLSYVGRLYAIASTVSGQTCYQSSLERETRLELATFSLEG